MKLTCFLYFGYEFKIKSSIMHEHVINNKEHVKKSYEQHSRLYLYDTMH